MPDIKDKIQNVHRAVGLFKTEPPVQSARESLGDFAYRALRDAIRAGRIAPGPHIRELDVARWLKISRTPVREAFHRIISEGLLTIGPWNGVMVAELTAKQLVDLYGCQKRNAGGSASNVRYRRNRVQGEARSIAACRHKCQIASSDLPRRA
jgi:DNA-binding GntR family transcriptional regulator